jgi:MFS family permease
MNWKRNLAVLWFGQFMTLSGMTMIIPFLSLYVQELGVADPEEVSLWTGLIFAANFVTSFVFQPFWGKLADRYGRKVMLLRSGFGMAAVMALMGFATAAWHLLALRILNGTISGFVPAATALISANTPRHKMGFAMGVLQSGGVAGTILGPLIGGILAEMFGFRPIFYITGGLLFIASSLAALIVKENFDRKEAAEQPKTTVLQTFRELQRIPQLTALFFVTFMIQFSIQSTAPQIPLYIQKLHGLELIALYSGLISAAAGVSNMIASPLLGRLADKLGGAERILMWCLIGSVIVTIPQAFVTAFWQLLGLRFLQGVCMAGLLPSVNSLLRKYAPNGMESRTYGFNSSAMALGNMVGPVTGGLLAPFFVIEGLFILGAVLFCLNVLWVRHALVSRARTGSRIPESSR